MNDNITVKQAFDEFIKFKKSYCDNSTVGYYKKNLRFFFDYLDSVNDVTTDQFMITELHRRILQDYIAFLRDKTKYENHPFKAPDQKQGNLKNSTIRIYVRSVRVYLSFIQDEYDLDINFKRPKLPKSDSKQTIPLFMYEVDELDDIFSQTTEQGLRNLCIIHLMLDAGLRSEEVIDLKVQDVSFEKNIIMINDSKNHKSRIVPLAWNLKIMLQAYLEILVESMEIQEDNYMLIKHGTHDGINYNVIKQLFFRIRNKIDLPRLHPHLLRHTFAVAYLCGGGNIEFLRDMLGHSDYEVTKIYVSMANAYRMMGADLYKLDDIFYVATK